MVLVTLSSHFPSVVVVVMLPPFLQTSALLDLSRDRLVSLDLALVDGDFLFLVFAPAFWGLSAQFAIMLVFVRCGFWTSATRATAQDFQRVWMPRPIPPLSLLDRVWWARLIWAEWPEAGSGRAGGSVLVRANRESNGAESSLSALTLTVVGSAAVGRRSGGRNRHARTPVESSRRPLRSCRSRISKRPPELDENGFEPSGFNSSDLLHPPLDQSDSEICGPPQRDLRSERWRSPLEPPIAEKRHDQRERADFAIECPRFGADMFLGLGGICLDFGILVI
ncbi:hypothetical protein GQ457_08G022810 [Hibiscus cannabinus]